MSAGTLASRLACSGCGRELLPVPDDDGRYPFRCPDARDGDDIDHLVTRILDPSSVRFPRDVDSNPFVAYRTMCHSWHVARAHGMPDDEYVSLVRRLDDEIARVDGGGFRVTPFESSEALAAALGLAHVWVKDETGNVSGSHKARHLAGLMIYLQVVEALGIVGAARPRLAIASCGNAALAAAVVARAGHRALDVFIPPDAPASVVARLRALDAATITCPRDSDAAGDPCYLRFRDAVARGSLPFCCQGSANGLTIEGGETIGWEMISAPGAPVLDAVVIQVGGGALASAVIQSFVDAHALGACARLPRFYTVQTAGAFPLKRAFDRVARTLAPDAAGSLPPPLNLRRAGQPSGLPASDRSIVTFDQTAVSRALEYAATHRHEFMWPWETEPRSIARGILDDETYDWRAVVAGMLRTGGRPVVVDDRTLVEAHDLARRSTGIPVDHTGAAGLAGLIELARAGEVERDDEVAVVFSGRER